MNDTISISGRKFNIQGDGFVRAQAEGDFDKIVALVGARLTGLADAELARLHAGSMFTDDGPTDDQAFDDLTRIVSEEAFLVMKDWHDPSGAFVSISAA
jgi:hypothetical protein